MRIGLSVTYKAMSDTLPEHVPHRSQDLALIAQAAIEVRLTSLVQPERRETLRQQVIHQLRNGTVKSLHERSQCLAVREIRDKMIVVVQQRRGPELNSKVLCVTKQAIPEDALSRA